MAGSPGQGLFLCPDRPTKFFSLVGENFFVTPTKYFSSVPTKIFSCPQTPIIMICIFISFNSLCNVYDVFRARRIARSMVSSRPRPRMTAPARNGTTDLCRQPLCALSRILSRNEPRKGLFFGLFTTNFRKKSGCAIAIFQNFIEVCGHLSWGGRK